jgi:Protein of unknown function (DUF1573)
LYKGCFISSLYFYHSIPMTKALSIITFLLIPIALFAQSGQDKSKGRFYFKEGEIHDMGVLPPTHIAMDTFWFENIGNTPIIIKFVSSSSSAFIATDWPREAIRPEQMGFVSCIVKPAKHTGNFNEDLFIESNAYTNPGETVYKLHIAGFISKDVNAKPVKKKKHPVKKPAPKPAT